MNITIWSQSLFSKRLSFSYLSGIKEKLKRTKHKKWMNLILDQLSTASIKYLNWPSPVFGRFQNGCNKVIIEPRVVQFWSEIILMILKSRAWFLPKLHSPQFNYHYLSLSLEEVNFPQRRRQNLNRTGFDHGLDHGSRKRKEFWKVKRNRLWNNDK